MVKQVFRVTDMHCSNCVMRLEGLEDDLPGVKRVRASYKKQQMEVEYDEGTVSAAQIVAAIQKFGYTVADDTAAVARTRRGSLASAAPAANAPNGAPPARNPALFASTSD